MSAAGSGGLPQAGIVGIGIGAGSLFLIAASAIFIKIYLRRRQHSLAVAEIERGFGHSSTRRSEKTEVSNQKSPFRRNMVLSRDSDEGYNVLSSSEQIHHVPKFASPKKAHPALLVVEEKAGEGQVDAAKWSRLDHISSKYRRVQALSAIIESPRSNLTRSSIPLTALIRVEHPSRAQSDVIEEGIQLAGNGQDFSPERGSRSPSIAVPPRSALRPLVLTPSGIAGKENVKPRAIRSKSIGSYISALPHETAANDVSNHKRPAMHGRSLSFGAQIVGPAPTGPLPALPSNAAMLDQINQQLAVALADTDRYTKRSWEGTVDPDLCNQEERLQTFAETQRRLERAASDNQLEKPDVPRPLSSSPYRISMRFSTDSAISKITAISSTRASLDNDFFNRLSIPVIETAERLDVSRVPSAASLRSDQALKMVTTPKRRRLVGSRVSGSGSPAERRKVLKAVSGNSTSPQRPISSMDKPLCISLHFDKAILSAKPSAMKATSGSRKGHRRQNFVRISTLAPTVFGPARSSSGSSFSMDEMCEAGEGPPYADRHMNGDITLRPKSQHFNPSRPRASLTWSKSAPLYSPHRPSCDSSPMSIPSFPSPTQEASDRIHGCTRNQITSTPPAMTFTRPSSEWKHNHESPLSSSPPFALHVTPSAPAPNLYDPGYAAQSQEYDPTWPTITELHDPPARGQEAEYDPGHDFALYSSPESSSKSSTKSLFDVSEESPDDFAEPFSGLTITTPTPAGPKETSKPPSSGSDRQAYDTKAAVTAEISSAFAQPSPPQTQHSPCLSQETDKENSSPISRSHVPSNLAPGATLPSPLATAPLLNPTIQPSTFRSSLPRPAILVQKSKWGSKTISPASIQDRPQSQNVSQPPSSSGISKQKNAKVVMGMSKRNGIKSASKNENRNGKCRPSLMGPRAAPPKDLRKSILELRRQNSELWFSSDDLDRLSDEDRRKACDDRVSDKDHAKGVYRCDSTTFPDTQQKQQEQWEQQQNGQRKHLKLGRQASPVLPFLGFGGLSRADCMADMSAIHHENWTEGGKKQKQKHISGFDFGFDKSLFSRSMSHDVNQNTTMRKEGQGEGEGNVECGYDDDSDDPRASMIVEKEVSPYAYGPSLFSSSHTAQGDKGAVSAARTAGRPGNGFARPTVEGSKAGTRSAHGLWTSDERREEGDDGSHQEKGKATPKSLYDETGFLRNSPLRGKVVRSGQVGIY